MAPLRSSRSNRNLQYDHTSSNARRQGGVIDHDPTDGLPVRKWEQQFVTVKQNQKEESDQATGPNPDYPWPELPLPKDFHQLPVHSQEMLRRARMGNRTKQTWSNDPRGTGIPDEDIVDDAENKPAAVDEDRSYTVRKWAPARVEKPDAKYLADRRAGLPPLYGFASYNEVAQPVKKMVKVRTTDPMTGQQRIFDTMILEGGEATVDGEIITEEEAAAIAASNADPANTNTAAPAVVTETLAPGTVVEGVGVVNEQGVVVAPAVTAAAAAAEATPIRRRPPPPKRKKHGPGRGRKKKVMFAPGEGAEAPNGGTAVGDSQATATTAGSQPADGANGATPMNLDGAGEDREDSMMQDEGEGEGDDESGDEEGSEEGEIDEDGDDGNGVDGTQETPALPTDDSIPETTAASDGTPLMEPTADTTTPQEEAVDTIPEPSDEPQVIPITAPDPIEPVAEAADTNEPTKPEEEEIPSEPLPPATSATGADVTEAAPMEESKVEPENVEPESGELAAIEPAITATAVESVGSGELDLLGNLEKTLDDEDEAPVEPTTTAIDDQKPDPES